jgi:DNA gyrase inhibitor GyrI
MLEYLHRSAADTTSYAEQMLDGGRYAIARHQILPDDMPQASPSEPLQAEL